MLRSAAMSPSSAIVVGSLIVAMGLFFGLRAREPAPTVVREPAPTVTREPAGPSATVPGVPTVVAAAGVVVAQASEALMYHRSALRERCYGPAVVGLETPPAVKMTFHLTFDAGGSQVVRGVTESRGTSIPEVTKCVLEQLPPLRVPAPGAVTQVDVVLDLP